MIYLLFLDFPTRYITSRRWFASEDSAVLRQRELSKLAIFRGRSSRWRKHNASHRCYSRRTLFALKCDCAGCYHCTSIKLTALSRPGKLTSASSTRPIVRLPRHLIGLSIIAQSSRPNFSFALSLSFSFSLKPERNAGWRTKCNVLDSDVRQHRSSRVYEIQAPARARSCCYGVTCNSMFNAGVNISLRTGSRHRDL